MFPVTVLTRDVLVKLPSSLQMDLYQSSDMDLENNDIGVVFMLHEIISQRTFDVLYASLYQQCCISVIVKCGFLICEEISIC